MAVPDISSLVETVEHLRDSAQGLGAFSEQQHALNEKLLAMIEALAFRVENIEKYLAIGVENEGREGASTKH